MKRMYFDLETSQMVVKTFSLWQDSINPSAIIKKPKIICASWKWEGEDEVHNIDWGAKQCDRKIVRKMLSEMKRADEVVAHNGDRFDIKWINTRCIYHRLDPFPISKTVDTLKIAKKYLKLPSNRLDAIGDYFGIGRKVQTPKGLWDRVESGCSESLKVMLDYCDQDVLLLEDVFKYLQPYIESATHIGAKEGGERWSCPKCGTHNVKQNKRRVSKKGITSFEMRCCNGHHFEISHKVWRDWQMWKIDEKNKMR